MSPKKEIPVKPKGASVSPEAAAVAAHRKERDGDLQRMFDDAGAEKPDMTRLDQVRHSRFKKFMFGLMAFFAVLATIAWAGVFFFTPGSGRFGGEGVELDVEGPSEVKSGEEVTYALHYKNGEAIALGTASLNLRLPKSFTVISREPAPDEDGSWSIGSIASGKSGLITVKGVFVETVGNTLDLQAILTYRPADFNSEFQKVTTKGVHISESVLEMTAEGPTKVLPGDKVTVSFSYKNASANDFKNVKLRAQYPPGFIPESTQPATVDEGKSEWDISELKSNADGKVSVTGSFASDAEGTQEIKGILGFLTADDVFSPQREAAFTTDVLKGDFITALIMNGKPGDQPVRFGDTLRFAVTYKNTGTVALGDVTLAVTVEPTAQGNLVRWNDLADTAKGVRKGNTVTWSSKQIPSLGRVDADDEGTIDFEVPVIDAPITGTSDADYQLHASLVATVGTIDGEVVKRESRAAPILAKFVSDTDFTSTGAYFNEDAIPVGKGPIPPKAGEATTYRITWKVKNSLHELNDLKISAKLPANVTWSGFQDVDAGNLQFDAAAEKMIWTLNWLPTNIREMNVNFDVTIAPTEDQKGKIPTLIDGAIFEATDKGNGYGLLLSAPPVTTAIESDETASGKGRVE